MKIEKNETFIHAYKRLLKEGKEQIAQLIEDLYLGSDSKITVSQINELSESGKIPISIYAEVVRELNLLDYISDSEPSTLAIPNGVTQIPDNFFTDSAYSLSQVLLPESITYIGDNAFSGNTGIAKIIIPKSVEYISPSAFTGCSQLSSIAVANDNPHYKGNGYITSKNGTRLIYCPENLYMNQASVFDSDSAFFDSNIIEVDDFAFYQSHFKYIKLPCLRVVGDYSFAHCSELKKLECRPIERCGIYAFAYCTALEDFDFSELNYIPIGMFFNATSLKKANFSDSLSYIDISAFEGASSLTDISDIHAFSIGLNAFNCTNIWRARLISCTSLGESAFANCLCLSEFSCYGQLESIPKGCFFGDKSLRDIQLPTTVKCIDDLAFSLCTELTCSEFPSSLSEIHAKAFSHCKSLEYGCDLPIPQNVSYIAPDAFDFCDNICCFSVDINNKYYYDIDGVLYLRERNGIDISLIKCPACLPLDGDEFVVPENVTSIKHHAFQNSCTIDCLRIGDSVKHIGHTAFEGSNIRSVYIGSSVNDCDSIHALSQLESIEVSPDNMHFSSCDGVLYSKDFTKLLKYPPKKKGDFTVRDEVLEIADNAFENAQYLQSISLNSSLRIIGAFAFLNCKSLHKVYVPDSVEFIGMDSLGVRMEPANRDFQCNSYYPMHDFQLLYDNSSAADEYYKNVLHYNEFSLDDDEDDEEEYYYDDDEGLF
ncbi:MAG: leucine-rich repeat protein [Acutalibacteraceae bacterium]